VGNGGRKLKVGDQQGSGPVVGGDQGGLDIGGGGEAARQSTGGCVRSAASNHMQPMPALQASHTPISDGATGTNSRNRVGRHVSESVRARKSEMVSKTLRFSHTRCLSPCARAACNTENKPREPGRAGAMDRSLPSN
jgi:hypothetical protein